MLPHIQTSQSLTVLLDGRSIAIPTSHPNYAEIIANLDDVDQVRALINVREAIGEWARGRIVVKDRVLYYNGLEISTSLTVKIVEFLREGNEKHVEPLCNFLDKVMENPSRRAVQGLYDWVSASSMPIHPDGDILAWKIVKSDFHDYRTGTFDHSPGNIVEQPRNQCDEDPDRTCSYGLHFCSFSYLPSYFSHHDDRKVVLVKINPRDVVAIPRDYNLAKGRCCRMEVIQEVPQSQLEDFFPTTTVFDTKAPLNVKAGQVWRDTWGDLHTVFDFDEESITTTDEEGDRWTFDQFGIGTNDAFDLDVLVEDTFPELKIGQLWCCRDGVERTIIELNDVNCAKLSGADWLWVFTDTGKVFHGNQESDHDLIELIAEPQVD